MRTLKTPHSVRSFFLATFLASFALNLLLWEMPAYTEMAGRSWRRHCRVVFRRPWRAMMVSSVCLLCCCGEAIGLDRACEEARILSR